MQLNWINVEKQKPENRQPVYVVIENERGQFFQTTALYAERRKVLCERSDEDSVEYDEKEGVYWVKEGFYEWNYSTGLWYHISDRVLKWHPMFGIYRANNFMGLAWKYPAKGDLPSKEEIVIAVKKEDGKSYPMEFFNEKFHQYWYDFEDHFDPCEIDAWCSLPVFND